MGTLGELFQPAAVSDWSQRGDLSIAIQFKHFVALQFLFQPAASLAQWSLARPQEVDANLPVGVRVGREWQFYQFARANSRWIS